MGVIFIPSKDAAAKRPVALSKVSDRLANSCLTRYVSTTVEVHVLHSKDH